MQRYQVDIDIWASALAQPAVWSDGNATRTIFYADLSRTISAYTDDSLITPVPLYDEDGNVLSQPAPISLITGKQVWVDYGQKVHFRLSDGSTFEETAPERPRQVFDPITYGAVADCITLTDGVVSSDGLTVSSSIANWDAARDNGKLIMAYKAGRVEAIETTMTVVSPHTATLSYPADSNVRGQSSVKICYATDNKVPFNTAMVDAAAVRGIWRLKDPGIYGVGFYEASGVGDTDGVAIHVLDGVTMELDHGVELVSFGKNLLYAYQKSGFKIYRPCLNGKSHNIGLMKFVECDDYLVEDPYCLNGGIQYDPINCTGKLRGGTFTTDEDLIAPAVRTDTRAVSVACRDIVAGDSNGMIAEGFKILGDPAYPFATAVRVLADSGKNIRGAVITDFTVSGCINGVSLERGDTTAICDANVNGFYIDSPTGLGVQFLLADRCHVSEFHIKNPTQAGILFFGSSYNRVLDAVVDGQKAGWSCLEFRDVSGRGSILNEVEGFRDVNAAVAQFSINDNIDALTGQNYISGVINKGFSTKTSTTLDVWSSGVRVVKRSTTATATAIADNATITLTDAEVVRINPAAARVGIILASGTFDGQRGTVRNEATAANSATMAAAGTSHVFGGVAVAIAGGTTRQFEWWSSDSLWHPL